MDKRYEDLTEDMKRQTIELWANMIIETKQEEAVDIFIENSKNIEDEDEQMLFMSVITTVLENL